MEIEHWIHKSKNEYNLMEIELEGTRTLIGNLIKIATIQHKQKSEGYR
jgi:hypothetical protein